MLEFGAILSIYKIGYTYGASLPQDDLFEILEIPEFEAFARVDGQPLHLGVPKQLVKEADWENWTDDGDEKDTRLIDFEEAIVKPKQLPYPHNAKLDQQFHDNAQDPALQCLLPVIRGLTSFRPSDQSSAAEALAMIAQALSALTSHSDSDSHSDSESSESWAAQRIPQSG
ncbi:predicted protein [Sclerotinia sclerotiorum 1980 UF-70]|uniref:Uncharacterized protein n=1 Tax=Sclerotinia sclerotiorum (strain ATCC 18683 / 1980 / Ss-1) TaxID=665079 RepID=A7E741_SCLS1|nr:predicted protein [Sclerotinia sclerotiorum 1980 UF-70]EDN96193.1 predicted protein [Sclerotinia sclerotiorum 1980 UF-70]